ncbi:DEAD/DEAH box helicase family protein [Lyngbya aestuarii BL J]|uniref:DEAD/DEAH box helicase family protein n=1 Tax=Lyngbya aestuarii BL J TaxID=1348334 RepID=U7QMX0_9CYAN|nr:helicase-related protein [Lyngbya aestuarii]ERT08622.1 DEAD/DEAH box helicase family protein [Lyngbya aestuarii BL J]
MIDSLISKRILIPSQFTEAVTVVSADIIDDTVLLQVRTSTGELREAGVSYSEIEEIITQQQNTSTLVDGDSLFLFIESARIKTAFEYDPHFAVSLSGVRPLPHQLEAVYERILPQVRLRFLLADDPGAGKTIMAGLLLKELKLRSAIERVLILTPASLTIQWQDELKSKFAETFEVITSTLAKNQLAGNPWERFRQCIASIDFAKRDEVISGLLQVDWDLVIIDEAHKCSARTQGEDLRRTGRYKLAEELSNNTERLLLLTATPHQGDIDQFHNFLRLLDPDQFISDTHNTQMLCLENSPWFLRRIKEELRDFEGQKLFKPRHAITVPFNLSQAEEYLYNQITTYINRYLGQTTGRRQATVALARTVLQRRLASSLNAIWNSLKRRYQRFSNLLEELEQLSPQEQRQRLMNFGCSVNTETDNEDRSEDELENVAVESTIAEKIEQLREELQELKRLVKLTQETIELGTERKLNELQNLLKRSEFDELSEGEGRLLIFTEHRDTLEYLKQNLQQWGYSTCEIHGGMNVIDRKAAQKNFQFNKQICIATEAAGEGINLQFCRLMVNYDIPWNPNRLEQRMGRIHRIGQKRDVYIFNFVAVNTVEGRVLEKLLKKLDEIRAAMNDRVFDVIGQLLQLNDIRFEELVRQATYSQADEDEAIAQIDRLSPERLKDLEQATGLALATSHVDFSRVRLKTQTQDFRSEERRLMPRYVEEFFKRACEYLHLNLEVRADGLWRIPYLKEEFRSNTLEAVRRLGTPEKYYPKLTFYKEQLEAAVHQDGEFLSPGHCLFASIAERLDYQLAERVGYRCATFVDADAQAPYRIHFFCVEIQGQTTQGREQTLRARLCAVAEYQSGSFVLVATDCLHDLAPADPPTTDVLKPLAPTEQQQVERWLKVKVQMTMMDEVRAQRQRELDIRRDYLAQAMEAAIREAQCTQMKLAAKVASGEETYRVARDSSQNKVRTLKERYKAKQDELKALNIVRLGRVAYLGTALVYPAPAEVAAGGMRNDPDVEAFAMEYVMDYERQRGWEPEDISQNRDGSGFDIRSVKPGDNATGLVPVRRIEVKGRAQFEQDVSLTANEWRRAQQLGDTYWLYVVWGCSTPTPQLLMIKNPAKKLAANVREVKEVTRYLINAKTIGSYAQTLNS